MRQITHDTIEQYRMYLIETEKSEATVKKYARDATAFCDWAKGREISKQLCLEYKEKLICGFADRSVNSIISSLNSLFCYLGWNDCRIKTLKIQRRIFADRSRELTKSDYERLLKAAKQEHNERLYMLMQTICATGIRVSELRYITAEAVMRGQANIRCKGKSRIVIIPKQLCGMLYKYMKKTGVSYGAVFVTRSGKPLNRSNIWHDMKRLCKISGVAASKVFPHNLRHLFARTYYSLERDIVRLSDILGHSSINTTRIYTMESGDVHRKQIEKMGLLRC